MHPNRQLICGLPQLTEIMMTMHPIEPGQLTQLCDKYMSDRLEVLEMTFVVLPHLNELFKVKQTELHTLMIDAAIPHPYPGDVGELRQFFETLLKCPKLKTLQLRGFSFVPDMVLFLRLLREMGLLPHLSTVEVAVEVMALTNTYDLTKPPGVAEVNLADGPSEYMRSRADVSRFIRSWTKGFLRSR